MNFKKAILLSSVALGLGLTGSAQALIISDSFITPSATTDLTNVTNTLALFDSSLGTLNSVTFEISAHSDSTTSLVNSSANSQFFKYDSNLNFLFSTSIASLSATLPAAPQLITTLATTGGFQSLASGATLNLGQIIDQAAFTTPVITTNLSDYMGAAGSNFDVTCSTLTSSNFTGGGGNITTNQTTTGQCDAKIIYDYTAAVTSNVPAPASLALLGMGLIGLRFGRKSAKKA